MKSKEIPEALMITVGKLLRQSRTARCLNLAEAADRVGISIEELANLEDGKAPATSDHLMFILAKYGGVRADAAEALLIRLMLEESRCQYQTQQRRHLALAGDDPKPWEKVRYAQVTRGL